MGRKVNPIGFRLKINRTWEGHWYGEGNRYREMLHEDFAIRRKLTRGMKELEGANIAKIEIARSPSEVVVTIFTAKPGIIIGRKGEQVKNIKQVLQDLTGKKIKVEVSEINKPDINAMLVADNIARQLEKRIGHSRAMKRAVSQALRQGAQGIKIYIGGRLAGSDMARRETQMEGRVPRSTLRSVIDYGTAEALTSYGRMGIKVWIYLGEKLKETAPEMPENSPTQN
jgi:small subunit ribosomal protein S3